MTTKLQSITFAELQNFYQSFDKPADPRFARIRGCFPQLPKRAPLPLGERTVVRDIMNGLKIFFDRYTVALEITPLSPEILEQLYATVQQKSEGALEKGLIGAKKNRANLLAVTKLALEDIDLLPDSLKRCEQLQELDLSNETVRLTELPDYLLDKPRKLSLNALLIPWIQTHSFLLYPQTTITFKTDPNMDRIGLWVRNQPVRKKQTSFTYVFSNNLNLPLITAIAKNSAMARKWLEENSLLVPEEQIANFWKHQPFSNLTSLDCTYVEISSKELELIRTFTSLESLAIGWDGEKITPEEIEIFIQNFPHLTSFTAYFTNYIDIHWNNFPKEFRDFKVSKSRDVANSSRFIWEYQVTYIKPPQTFLRRFWSTSVWIAAKIFAPIIFICRRILMPLASWLLKRAHMWQ